MHLVTMAMDGISGSNESRVKPDRLKLQAQYNYSSLTFAMDKYIFHDVFIN